MTHYALYVIITVWSNDLNTSVSIHNDSFIFQNVDLAWQRSSLCQSGCRSLHLFFPPFFLNFPCAVTTFTVKLHTSPAIVPRSDFLSKTAVEVSALLKCGFVKQHFVVITCRLKFSIRSVACRRLWAGFLSSPLPAPQGLLHKSFNDA